MIDSESNSKQTSVLHPELIDELESEINKFWESEKSRTGKEIEREAAAELWLDRYYDRWLSDHQQDELEGIAKRRYHRIDFEHPASLKILWTPDGKLDGSDHNVTLRDISAGGLYFFSELDIPDTSLLQLVIQFPNSDVVDEMMGVIVRKTEKDVGWGFGVSYSHIEDEARDRIKSLVARRL